MEHFEEGETLRVYRIGQDREKGKVDRMKWIKWMGLTGDRRSPV